MSRIVVLNKIIFARVRTKDRMKIQRPEEIWVSIEMYCGAVFNSVSLRQQSFTPVPCPLPAKSVDDRITACRHSVGVLVGTGRHRHISGECWIIAKTPTSDSQGIPGSFTDTLASRGVIKPLFICRSHSTRSLTLSKKEYVRIRARHT